MPLLDIVSHPAKVLLERGAPVTAFDDALKGLINDMFQTMYDDGGVGLAAPQVGLSLRLFVMDCENVKLVAANPEIIGREGEVWREEGCLSVGKIRAPLARARKVRLRAQNAAGEFFEIETEGVPARCFLHETDHCDGKLFIEHLSAPERELVLRQFAKLKKSPAHAES